MGMYAAKCESCGREFQWFSGNTGKPQLCAFCLPVGDTALKVPGTPTAPSKSVDQEIEDIIDNAIDKVSNSFESCGHTIKFEEPVSDKHIHVKLQIAIEALRFYYENRVRLGIDGGAAHKALILCGEDPKQRRRTDS